MLEFALLSVCCALFGAAIVSDLAGRWIPNSIPIVLLILFAPYAVIGSHLASVWAHIAISVVLLLVGFSLFSFSGLGGGDGKLMAVAGLWVGPHDLTLFLVGLGLISLCLSLFALLPFERTRRLRSNLPFAVAIAPPAIVLLALRAFSV